jgi:hypothetical protein
MTVALNGENNKNKNTKKKKPEVKNRTKFHTEYI